MRNKVRIIGMSLASMAGILLVSGVAWAQATKMPVSGGVRNFVITDPGKIWVDEEGVKHIRNERRRERYTGDIQGRQFAIESLNIDIDPVTGEPLALDYHASFTFVGFVLGDRVTATGRLMGLCSGGLAEPNNCEEIEIWHLDDGRKINLTEVWSLSGGDSVYEGILLDPPGRR
jgi:hypothetical protein